MWSITSVAKQMPNPREYLMTWLKEREKEKPETWNTESEFKLRIAPIEKYFED